MTSRNLRCAASSTLPAPCCTPISAGRCCRGRRSRPRPRRRRSPRTSSTTSRRASAVSATSTWKRSYAASRGPRLLPRSTTTRAPCCSRSSRSPRGARCRCRAASWWKSAARSASRKSSRRQAAPSAKSAPPTARTSRTTRRPSGRRRPPSSKCTRAITPWSASPPRLRRASSRSSHARGLPFVVDLGSGSLVDLQRWGLPAEPTPMRSLAAGADLVTFSGDKLLGGPQAGLVVGRRAFVERLRRNPMKRALRVDKGRIAALEAVLRLYLDPERLRERLPTLRLLTRPVVQIAALAARVRAPLQAWCGAKARVSVEECASQVGSGSLPVDRLPSAALRIASPGVKPAVIAMALRALPIPVIGRIHDDALWLDLRCLEDEAAFVQMLEGRHL